MARDSARMTTSAYDPFSQSFDSIEIDPTRAPSAQTIEHAFAACAPETGLAEPGFYLIDDAGGRFVVDRDIGVISVRDEAILEGERFAIHTVRVKVIEQSGASYEMEMKLRLTGLVPQMVGAEDALFDLPAQATTPAQNATPARVSIAPPAHWAAYAAARARIGKAELERTRRAFIKSDLPMAEPVFECAALRLITDLPPVGLLGEWSL